MTLGRRWKTRGRGTSLPSEGEGHLNDRDTRTNKGICTPWPALGDAHYRRLPSVVRGRNPVGGERGRRPTCPLVLQRWANAVLGAAGDGALALDQHWALHLGADARQAHRPPARRDKVIGVEAELSEVRILAQTVDAESMQGNPVSASCAAATAARSESAISLRAF